MCKLMRARACVCVATVCIKKILVYEYNKYEYKINDVEIVRSMLRTSTDGAEGWRYYYAEEYS